MGEGKRCEGEWLARNRELHEIVKRTKDISPVGTGKGEMWVNPLAELNKQYGISRFYALEEEHFGLGTDVVEEYGEQQSRHLSMRFSGLRDQAVADKIHNRLDEIVYAMGDPCYLPDVPGIVQLMSQCGPAESRVGSIDQDTAAPLLNELSAYLSPYLVDSFRKVVNNQWPEEVFEGKPLLKHLRMLEGYPME